MGREPVSERLLYESAAWLSRQWRHWPEGATEPEILKRLKDSETAPQGLARKLGAVLEVLVERKAIAISRRPRAVLSLDQGPVYSRASRVVFGEWDS